MKNVKIIIYLHLDFAKTQESIRELFLPQRAQRTQRTLFIIFFSLCTLVAVVFFKFSFIHDFMIIILK